jgi:fluoride exporter
MASEVADVEERPFHPRPAPRHRQDPRVLGAIALGGFVGGEARYLLGLTFPTAHNGFPAFPATTFAINVSGSFLLALLLVLILKVWPLTRYLRPALCTGLCGGYTTFPAAAANIAASITAGLLAAAAGLGIAPAL